MAAPIADQNLYNSTHHFQSIHPAPVNINHFNVAHEQHDMHQQCQESNLTKLSPSNMNSRLYMPNNKNYFNSSLSSFTSINKNKNATNQQQVQQSNQQSIHLSPSPLAISDGMPIFYGNSNVTQTFTPTSLSNIKPE